MRIQPPHVNARCVAQPVIHAALEAEARSVVGIVTKVNPAIGAEGRRIRAHGGQQRIAAAVAGIALYRLGTRFHVIDAAPIPVVGAADQNPQALTFPEALAESTAELIRAPRVEDGRKCADAEERNRRTVARCARA